MDKGRKHKRTRRDEPSPTNNKRQKITSSPKTNTCTGSAKTGCSAQSRLDRIRMQQSANESKIISGNASFESSIDHSKLASNVIKFPISDRENKSFHWNDGHTRTSAQGRLSNHQSFHSSTPLRNDTAKQLSKSCENTSGSVLPNERSQSASDRLKIHTALEGSVSKLHSSSEDAFKTSNRRVASSPVGLFKTPSPSNRLKGYLMPDASFVGRVSNRQKVGSVSSIKSPFKSVSDRLKVDSVSSNESERFQAHGTPVTSFRDDFTIKSDGLTTSINKSSPCDRLKAHSTPITFLETGVDGTSSTPSVSVSRPFKRAHSPPTSSGSEFQDKSKKLKTPSDRLKTHSTESGFNVKLQNETKLASKPFPSFEYMSNKLKIFSAPLSSFFKGASDRLSFRPQIEKESDPPSSPSQNSHLSPSCRNKIATRDRFKEMVYSDSFEDSSYSNPSSKAAGSFSNVSENSAFSERGADLHEGNEVSVDSVILMEDDSDMDWSPETQEDVVADIRTVRDKKSVHNQTSFHDSTPRNFPQTADEASGVDNRRNLYVIIDTNIFINKLQVIPSILKIEYEDGTFPIVYVPWMVIQELDYFKDGYNVTAKHASSSVLKSKSMKAIRFINENLISKRTNFVCQPALDATENQLKILSPDDSILSCCFQVGKQSRVMLLSGDVNLCNKAMINSFEVLKPDDAVETLSDLKKLKHKVDLIEKVSECMSRLCSFIIYSEWKRTGDKEDAAGFKRMPWSFPDCIRYMKENYTRVFKPFLQKQSQKIIDDIYNIVILDQDLADETKFIELTLSLLIFMKTGLSKYELNVAATIGDIKKLKKMQ